MTIEKNIHGAWVISDLINGHLISRTYYFYTKKEAKSLFLYEMSLNNKRKGA